MKRILFALIAVITVLTTGINPTLAKSDKCVECTSCADSCEKALNYLTKGDKKVDESKLAAIRDCITLCRASADLGKRNSDLSQKLAAVCADACAKCAEACKSLEDDKLKDCISQCQSCHICCDKTASAKSGKDDCCEQKADAKASMPECCQIKADAKGAKPDCCQEKAGVTPDCCQEHEATK